MYRSSVGISNIIRKRDEKKNQDVKFPDFDEDSIGSVEAVTIESIEAEDVFVDMSKANVEAVEISAINDEHGRISDVIEALEQTTGLSVVPLEMAHVAPEVQSLSRHTIFENNGIRYAMSHHIRYDVINHMQERITKSLSSALPFSECLNKIITYNGVDYEILTLSEDEWTLLMAKFRKYKERLYRTSEGKYYLEVLAERA